jgi:hypothetical protein
MQAVDKCDDHCHARDEVNANNRDNDGAFNLLFVANLLQSWYQKDNSGCFGGYAQYESRTRAALRPYSQISLVGDSMGGRAALLFSHLATDAVVAISLQEDLKREASHMGQSDMTPGIRRKFCNMLYRGVRSALDAGVDIIVHWGSEESNVQHTDFLEDHFLTCRAKERAARKGGGILGCPIRKEPICKECWKEGYDKHT